MEIIRKDERAIHTFLCRHQLRNYVVRFKTKGIKYFWISVEI